LFYFINLFCGARKLEAKTVKVFFEVKEEYLNPNFVMENALKKGEWNSVIPKKGFIPLANILSKDNSFWYMLRLSEKTDNIKVYGVSKKTETRNNVFKDFKGRYSKKDEYDERIFCIDFFDEETNERVFKGTLKIGKKTIQDTILCNAFIDKPALD